MVPDVNNSLNTAGNIQRYYSNWLNITSNKFVLRIIREGYKLQFVHNFVLPKNVVSRPICNEKSSILQAQIDKLLISGAISIVSPDPTQVLSRVFTVKKSNGDDRMIIDLSKINTQINKVKFKMETYEKIVDIISPNDYMASIDLCDAFLSIPIHAHSKKYLSFQFNDIRYQFNVLPFGLTSSPRIFSKILKAAIISLRSQGINILFYLDDIFICASDRDKLVSHVNTAVKLLSSLGFYPNFSKSNLSPTRQLTHLGFSWNTVDMTLSIPRGKHEKIVSCANHLLSNRVTLRKLASFIGLANSFYPAFKSAPLHYRALQFNYAHYIKMNTPWDVYIGLDAEARRDLLWWSTCTFPLPPSSLSAPQSNVSLYTDASNLGWGGILSSGEHTSGLWSVNESAMHINALEMLSIFNCLKDFSHLIRGQTVKIFCDNFSTVSYLNKRGGTHSKELCSLALETWDLLLKLRIICTAHHISGSENNEADFLSRSSNNSHEYSLNQQFFNSILFNIPFLPVIDLFASSSNTKLTNFASWRYCRNALYIDSFSFGWPDNIYLFPPISLLSKCVKKIIVDNVQNALLITPAWPGLVCLPTILSKLICNPIFIPYKYLEGQLPTRHSFNLMGWVISCNPAKIENYQKQLHNHFSIVSLQQQWQHISGIGNNLLNILTKKKFPIQFL